MKILPANRWFIAGSLLMISFVFLGVYLWQPALFFVPALLLAALLLLQYPSLLFFALLFFIPWSAEINFTTTLATDLPDEPLMLLLSYAMLLLVMVRLTQKKAVSLHPVLLILFTSLGWTLLTVLASTHFLLSLKYLLAKGWYLLSFAAAPFLLKGDKKFMKQSVFVLVFSTLSVTIIILINHAALGFSFAVINKAVVPFFRNHVNYSALLVFMVPLLVSFYRLEPKPWRRKMVLAALLMVLAALYFSFARGAWIALGVGAFSFWLIRRGWLVHSFLVFILVTGSLIMWLQHNNRYLAFAPHYSTTIYHSDFSDHLVATYKGKDVSTAERFYRWVAGVRMSTDNWVTGFGPTTFYPNYKSYTIPAFRTWVSDNPEHSTVHNYFLLLLIEQGLPGLLLFLLLVGSLFWYAQKIYRRTNSPFWKTATAAIASILWMQCTLNFLSDLIETDKVGSVFYLCVAFLVIADAKTKGIAEDEKKENNRIVQTVKEQI